MSIVTRGLLIGGREIPSTDNRLVDDISPWTGEVYAKVAAASPADVTAAVDAAAAAFPAWAAMRPFQRRKIFLRAADLMEARIENAIATMAGEVGGARPWAKFNVELCVEILREAAAAITQPVGQMLATDTPGARSYAKRVPYGVIAAISPWNAPYILGIRSIAIPLAVGNTVVMKPSEDAPISCGLYLADVLNEAGLPAGVLNVVTDDLKDAGTVVSTLIADPRVRLVNFTGSTNVGRIIGVEAAKNLKPAVLELGGKNALVVLKDADVDYAVKSAIFGAYINSGQICMSTDRVIVVRAIADQFVEKFTKAVDAIPYGDPSDPRTLVGPVVNIRAAKRVSALVKDAISKGAKVLAGSGEIEGPAGTLLKPMLLADITKDMDIFYGEIFGPATVVHVVDTIDEAVALANDSEYGLTGGVISENLMEALDVAERIQTGIIHVNDQGIADEPMAPFGGVKNTGYGRFGGQAGMDAFSATRWITVQERGHAKY
ncbi:aldehyde dehydrogenase family protein [Labrys portucalensis]|uniref:Aldehyde dehydrogenase family protein n=1 Tax=Labrys neptuniae TaxID=376174 RepID=A0ABV6ZS10_9HYPH